MPNDPLTAAKEMLAELKRRHQAYYAIDLVPHLARWKAAIKAAGGQPIETAPRNWGERFMVHTKRCGWVVVENDPDNPMPESIVPSGHSLMVFDGKDYHQLRGDYPTHWRPLPEPPKGADDE
jgi:hypothetical protein